MTPAAAAPALPGDAAEVGRAGCWSRSSALGGRSVLLPDDPEFPELAPAHRRTRRRSLFALGDLVAAGAAGASRSSAAAITRATAREVCAAVAWGRGRAGVAVVSGMARGLDAVAHDAALDAGGATIGVLGNGLGVIYPAANRAALRARGRATGCCSPSFRPASGPHAGSFPRRNRLISGLARVTVVVEAAEGSGALITADAALEQGRDVHGGARDRSPVATSVGTNRLIRDGAAPLLEPRRPPRRTTRSCARPAQLDPARPAVARPLPDDLAPTGLRQCADAAWRRAGAARRARRPVGAARAAKCWRCCVGWRSRVSVEQRPGTEVPVPQDLVTALDIGVGHISRGAPLHPRPLLRPPLQLLRLRHRGAARRALGCLRATRCSGSGTAGRTTRAGIESPSVRHDLLRRRHAVAARPRRHLGASSSASRSDRHGRAGAEITLEANPDDVTQQRGRGLARPPASTGSRSGCSRSIPACCVDAPHPHRGPGRRGGGDAPRTPGSRTSRSISSSACPPRLERDWARDLERGARARAGASLALRTHGRRRARRSAGGPHAARSCPVDEDRYAAEYLAADARARRGGFRALRGLQLRAGPGIAPGTTAPTGGGRRSSVSGRRPTARGERQRQWNLREWAAYERAVAARAATRSPERSGWTTRRCRWRSCTSVSGPGRGSPPSACRPETRDGLASSGLGGADRTAGSDSRPRAGSGSTPWWPACSASTRVGS